MVPVLGEPAPPHPGTRQLTQTELEKQLADYTSQAITATGLPHGWYWGQKAAGHTLDWDPSTTKGIPADPCTTVGTKGSQQLRVVISHDPIGDPVPLIKKMAAHWEAQGFTVSTYADIDNPGYRAIAIRADRVDGIGYGFTATTKILGLDVASQCSTDRSLTDYLDSLHDETDE